MSSKSFRLGFVGSLFILFSTQVLAESTYPAVKGALTPQASKYECPFASKTPALTGLKEQIRTLAGQTLDPGKQDGRCQQLMSQFRTNSDSFQKLQEAISIDKDTGAIRTYSAEETRSRLAIGDSLTGLLNAGCSFKENGRFLEGSLTFMDALASGVSATGFYSPVNFVIGAGIAAASRLGLAIANWFKNNSAEFVNLKKEMKSDSFKDRLCTFRSLAYRVDELDPGLKDLSKRQTAIEDERAKNAQRMASDQFRCLRDAELNSQNVFTWLKQVQPVLGQLQAKDPSQKCDELRYLLGEKSSLIDSTTSQIGCDDPAKTKSPRQQDFCERWKAFSSKKESIDCLGGDSKKNAKLARFINEGLFVLNNLAAVTTENIQRTGAASGDLFAQFVQLRDANSLLAAESERLKQLAKSPQNESEVIQADLMLKEIGGILLKDGLPDYADHNREQAQHFFETAQSALKKGRHKNKCNASLAARHEFRFVQPKLTNLKQICETLGANGEPRPPFNESSRDFNTITGEENRKKTSVFSSKRQSPLQNVCAVKQIPTDKEISELGSKIDKLFSENCPPEGP